MKTILAPVDFSPITQRVVEEAAALARALAGRLVLLNVVPPPPMMASEFADSDVAVQVVERAERIAARKLSRLQKQLSAGHVTAHAIHLVGLPGPRIVEQAERLEADYIVIGSHGHGALYDVLVGSTATRVLKDTPCPIIVVPPVETVIHSSEAPAEQQRECVEV